MQHAATLDGFSLTKLQSKRAVSEKYCANSNYLSFIWARRPNRSKNLRIEGHVTSNCSVDNTNVSIFNTSSFVTTWLTTFKIVFKSGG